VDIWVSQEKLIIVFSADFKNSDAPRTIISGRHRQLNALHQNCSPGPTNSLPERSGGRGHETKNASEVTPIQATRMAKDL